MNSFGRVAALALILAVAPVFAALAQQQAAQVRVDPVVMQTASETVPVIGRLVAREASTVAARAAGPVQAVPVSVGDRVEAGQPLAELVPDRQEAEVALLSAEVSEARSRREAAVATRQIAQQTVDRLEGLRGSSAFSQGVYDDARQELARAQSQFAETQAAINRAQARLSQARIDLDHGIIRSPFPGVVSEKLVEAGEFVSIGSPVATVVNDTDLEVEANVASVRVAALEPGVPVTIVLDDGTSHDAVVRAVVPVEDSLTRTRTVRFVPIFGAITKPLAAEQSATILIPGIAEAEVMTVAKDAVILGPRGASVFVVGPDRAVQRRDVVIGRAVGDRFIVQDGLQPGAMVVTRGNERLRPGQPVDFES